ncbi:MAG: hypothetical protein QNI97_14310 [Desulfobacterales bacterium]|nr:hypothetical protein [Desulfobacterales bacterium]
MARDPKKPPDFFEPSPLDPMRTATGGRTPEAAVPKKKAGFYLSLDVLDRFERKFYELKLAGVPVGNKSALLEAALNFALDDLDRNPESRVLKRD